MRQDPNVLNVDLKITYSGKLLESDQLKSFEKNCMDHAVQTMIDSFPESAAFSYHVNIEHSTERSISALVGQLESCGVTITGRDKVLDLAGTGSWQVELLELLQRGRHMGVQFTRRDQNPPRDVDIDRILAPYQFTDFHRDVILGNILPSREARAAR